MRKVNIETLSVDSSAIQSMRYFRKERSLVVKFQNDANYLYQGVPVRLFQRMRNSYSIGKFFNKYIKNNFQLGQLFILVKGCWLPRITVNCTAQRNLNPAGGFIP